MKTLPIFLAVFAGILSTSNAGLEDEVFGKTYAGKIDQGMALKWIHAQGGQLAIRKTTVTLTIDEDGQFIYQAMGRSYPGEAAVMSNGTLALAFEGNDRYLPSGVFIPLQITSDGALRGTGFVLHEVQQADREEVQPSVEIEPLATAPVVKRERVKVKPRAERRQVEVEFDDIDELEVGAALPAVPPGVYVVPIVPLYPVDPLPNFAPVRRAGRGLFGPRY